MRKGDEMWCVQRDGSHTGLAKNTRTNLPLPTLSDLSTIAPKQTKEKGVGLSTLYQLNHVTIPLSPNSNNHNKQKHKSYSNSTLETARQVGIHYQQ